MKRLAPLGPIHLLLAAQALWLLVVRALSGVGFGWSPVLLSEGRAGVGWLTNASDSFFYSSWLEQARAGHQPMEILYTTTPHAARYLNPALWLPGSLSRWLGGDPAGWLNLFGFVAALTVTATVYAIGLRLRLGHAAAAWAAATAAFASGWSWLLLAACKFLSIDALRGADLRFMDLVPSACMLVYPYHTIGLALLALLWWCVLKLELPDEARPSGVAPWCAVAALAALLASSRPYEPCAFLLAYGGYLLVTWPNSLRAERVRRLKIFTVVGLAGAPFVIASLWLAVQPVWRQFSSLALTLHHPRSFWLVGFGGLWLLAALGAVRLWLDAVPAARFAVVWAAGLFALLIVGNLPTTKLAAGGGLAITLCAGAALSRLWQPRSLGRLGAAVLAILLLAGPGSLLAVAREAILYPPSVDADLLAIARHLRPEPAERLATVLCEKSAGEILPGVAGIRVIAGHWALTPGFDALCAELADAGLESVSASPGSATDTVSQYDNLRALIARHRCDHLLLRRERRVASQVADSPEFELVAARGPWLLYRCRAAGSATGTGDAPPPSPARSSQ